MRRLAFLCCVLPALPLAALAQPIPGMDVTGQQNSDQRTYNVTPMNYYMWCQEQQHYEYKRCHERREEDVAAFETYRSAVERYEVEYLQQLEKEENLRALGNRDPSQTVRAKENTPLQ